MSDNASGASKKDRPDILIHPPILFAGTLVLGLLLDWIMPFLNSWVITGILAYPGWLLFILGLMLMSGAILQFMTAGTNVRPDQPSVVLVKSGLYSYSRNPIYLGAIAMLLGLSFLLNAPWMTLLVAGMTMVLHFGVVIPEEEYLTEKFGQPYTDYLKDTPRWLVGIG